MERNCTAPLRHLLRWRESVNPILESTITCPRCGDPKKEMMPTDACVFFWDCSRCGARLKPKPGDCCAISPP
jgi:hypothetical protein